MCNKKIVYNERLRHVFPSFKLSPEPSKVTKISERIELLIFKKLVVQTEIDINITLAKTRFHLLSLFCKQRSHFRTSIVHIQIYDFWNT